MKVKSFQLLGSLEVIILTLKTLDSTQSEWKGLERLQEIIDLLPQVKIRYR